MSDLASLINWFDGDAHPIEITVRDNDDVLVDLTGATAWFTVKNSKLDTDANALFQKISGGSGITFDTVDDGDGPVLAKIVIQIAEVDTKDKNPGKYFYDAQVKLTGSNDIHTVKEGIFHLKLGVTDAS